MIYLEEFYARVNSIDLAKKYFGDDLFRNEKIIEKKNSDIKFKNEKVKEFYREYENEIFSFKRGKLRKIYDDLKLKVEFILNTIDNSRKIIINSTKVRYTDYKNKDNCFYIETAENLWSKRESNEIIADGKEKTSYVEVMASNNNENIADISFISTVNVLDKDNIGVYFINNNKKLYVYYFGKEKDFKTFLLG